MPSRMLQHKPEQDFIVLIELFAEMIESQRLEILSSEEAWSNHAQILAEKLFKQACSVNVLLNPTLLDLQSGERIEFIDHSSATILARACLETFIVFHWIFQGQDPALRKFRHGVWRLGGLTDRLKLHPVTDQGREIIKVTRLQVTQQIAEIEASPYLGEYKPEQIKRLLKGDWRIGWSWTDEAVRASFNRNYFQNVYSHLCGYAHSSYISSTQMGKAQSLELQGMLGSMALQTCVHVVAKAVSFYADLFPRGRAALEAAPEEARKVASAWRFTGSDMEHLYDKN